MMDWKRFEDEMPPSFDENQVLVWSGRWLPELLTYDGRFGDVWRDQGGGKQQVPGTNTHWCLVTPP